MCKKELTILSEKDSRIQQRNYEKWIVLNWERLTREGYVKDHGKHIELIKPLSPDELGRMNLHIQQATANQRPQEKTRPRISFPRPQR